MSEEYYMKISDNYEAEGAYAFCGGGVMKRQKKEKFYRKGIKWGLLLLYIGMLALGLAAWIVPFWLVAWL